MYVFVCGGQCCVCLCEVLCVWDGLSLSLLSQAERKHFEDTVYQEVEECHCDYQTEISASSGNTNIIPAVKEVRASMHSVYMGRGICTYTVYI